MTFCSGVYRRTAPSDRRWTATWPRLTFAVVLAVGLSAPLAFAIEGDFGPTQSTPLLALPTPTSVESTTLVADEPLLLASQEPTDDDRTGDGNDAEQATDEQPEFVPMADYQSLLERVEELDESWTKYKEKVDEESAEKKKKPTLKINGRVHLDQYSFLESDDDINFLENGNEIDEPEDRWVFRRIRLELAGDVPNNMVYRLQIDFNNPQTPEYKDVYLGFNNLPNNQSFLIGHQKRPIGLDHWNSSRNNVFMERPLAVETFNEDARRLGAAMYGYTDDEMLNWQYGVFLLENTNISGRYVGNFDEAGLYGRLAASPWYDEVSGGRGYYHCAIAGSVNQTDGDGTLDSGSNSNEARFRTRPQARSDSRWLDTGRILGANNYEQLAFESMLNIGSLQITAEYINNWVQRDPLGGFSGEDLHFHGGYIFANYFLTGEYIPLQRTLGMIDRVIPLQNFFVVDRCGGGTGYGLGALAVGLRYDHLDLTDNDIQGGIGNSVTFATNWYWTAYSKLQTDLIWGEISQAGEGRTPTPGAAPDRNGSYSILGMRYMIDF